MESEPIDLHKAVSDGDGDAEAGDETLVKTPAEDTPWKTRIWEVFTTFWPLGFVGKIFQNFMCDVCANII